MRQITHDGSTEADFGVSNRHLSALAMLHSSMTPGRIGSILEEVNRLTRLVESLLTISRADAGHIHLQKSSLRLLDVLQESTALLDVLAEEKNQAIVVDGDPSVTIQADRLILRQVLISLVDNAAKYSPKGAKIRVDVRAADGNAFVEVRDSGPGIPPSTRKRSLSAPIASTKRVPEPKAALVWDS